MPPGHGRKDLHIYLDATWAEYAAKEAATLGVSVSDLMAATLKRWKDPELESRGELTDLMNALRLDLARLQPALAQVEAISGQMQRLEQMLQQIEHRLTQTPRWHRWLPRFLRRGHGNDEP